MKKEIPLLNNMNPGSNLDFDEVPKGLKEAKDPAFPVDSQAIIKADHMKGMDGG